MARKPKPEAEPARLEIRYIPLADAAKWDRNAKRHDLDGIKASIARHGFRDAPIYDGTLGAIAAGNGRVAALEAMQAAGQAPPRGIATDAGRWLVPVQFGLDAPSRSAAESFAVDHNNLTLGPGFDAIDAARLWDGPGYAALLTALEADGQTPVSLEGDLEAVLAGLDDAPMGFVSDPDGSPDAGPDAGDDTPPPASHVRMVQLFLTTETFPEFNAWVAALGEHYGTANATDTVMECLRRAHSAL